MNFTYNDNVVVAETGFEPVTHAFSGRCSTGLSYSALHVVIINNKNYFNHEKLSFHVVNHNRTPRRSQNHLEGLLSYFF